MCKVNKCSDLIVGSEPEYTLGNYDRPADWPTDRWKGDKCSNESIGSETKFTYSKLRFTNRPTDQPMDQPMDRKTDRKRERKRERETEGEREREREREREMWTLPWYCMLSLVLEKMIRVLMELFQHNYGQVRLYIYSLGFEMGMAELS